MEKGKLSLIIRQAKKEEILGLFSEGYKEWSKGRTFQQYCIDNGKEDAYGTRFVIEENGEIVSSLILLNLKPVFGEKAFGIGSVLTPKVHSGKGYATNLIKYCIKLVGEASFLFLYSDIKPAFYERLGFRQLPGNLQKYKKSICMTFCSDESWDKILKSSQEDIPDYF